MKFSNSRLVAAAFLPTTIFALGNSTNSSTTSSEEGLLTGIYLGDWQDAYDKASAIVAGLSNDDKFTIITGGSVTDVNFTARVFLDGTQGPQAYDYATGFMQGSAISMLWDKDAVKTQFTAVAQEFYQKGINIANAPTSQPLGRTAWGGRNVEALGFDSYLNGIYFGIGAKAFSDVGVISGGKHFLLNEQETDRTTPYTSNADDKTIHETYLWPWYDGVKAGMGAVMCAMTEVNGTMSCENADLLLKNLKTEMGFPGLVYPDVNGQKTANGSANGGLDYGSSSTWSTATMTALLDNGTLSTARLDDMVTRNLMGYFYTNQDNGLQPSEAGLSDYVDVRGNHSKIVRSLGAQSLVLLKNTAGALPLNKPRSMALFGPHAGPVMAGPNYIFSVTGAPSTYDGHLAGGSGSEQTSFPYLITPQQALTYRASQDGTMIRWILNNTYTEDDTYAFFRRRQLGGDFGGNGTGFGNGTGGGFPGGGGGGGGGAGGGGGVAGLSGGTSISQSISAYSSGVEVCLVFMNAFSGEGADRTELRNTEQDELVVDVAANCNNTIVIINTTGPRLVDAWIENENVTAVVYGSLLGQESGNSIMDVLYGDVNPSGRLPYTIAKNESDYNVEICETVTCNFTEGNYIDYKYFDAYNVTPRYEFGFGLSYSTFEYSNFAVSITNQTALSSTYPTGILAVGGKEDLWDEVISVSVDVTNTGTLDGADVPQLYIQYPDAADAALRQLRGFEKVSLTAGETQTVTFSIRRRDLSGWDVTAQDWSIISGDYIFSVGASSRDLRLNSTITV